MERLFGILGSGNLAQRQNALCVLSELLNTLSSSEHDMVNAVRQNVAIHLLKRLGDVELANRIEVSRLFAKLDPEFVLPALVQQVYSRDEKVRSAASTSIVSVLRGHSDPCAVLCVLLDCTSNIIQKAMPPMHPGHIGMSINEGSLPDVDRIMRLIPPWACEVQGWERLIELILKKMFSEPSNPVMPRFLSQISTHLFDNIGVVFKHVFALMAAQSKVSEDLIQNLNGGDTNQPQARLDNLIFEQLSPLLVLKVLPLAAFDDATCKELYGIKSGSGEKHFCEDMCITQFLIDRSSGKYEAYEVRKLSAELLGRCIPNIILPLLMKRLESAVQKQDTLEAKSFLFSLCNVVLLRGKTALDDPCMPHIQGLLSQILLWPCSATDEDTFKAQHGCIDCFALMIIAELAPSTTDNGLVEEVPTSMQKDSTSKHIEEIEEDRSQNGYSGAQPKLQQSVLSSVVSSILGQHEAVPFLPNHSWEAAEVSTSVTSAPRIILEDPMTRIAFRVCMANVLIRATQKLALKERHFFVSHVLPPIMDFVQVGKDSRVKSACLQILFTIVHNIKEGIISYAVDLFSLSLGIMRSKASAEERLAATRLLASLLTSADEVISEVAPYLSEASLTLGSISRMDSSSELRAFCEKLLDCMAPPIFGVQPY